MKIEKYTDFKKDRELTAKLNEAKINLKKLDPFLDDLREIVEKMVDAPKEAKWELSKYLQAFLREVIGEKTSELLKRRDEEGVEELLELLTALKYNIGVKVF